MARLRRFIEKPSRLQIVASLVLGALAVSLLTRFGDHSFSPQSISADQLDVPVHHLLHLDSAIVAWRGATLVLGCCMAAYTSYLVYGAISFAYTAGFKKGSLVITVPGLFGILGYFVSDHFSDPRVDCLAELGMGQYAIARNVLWAGAVFMATAAIMCSGRIADEVPEYQEGSDPQRFAESIASRTHWLRNLLVLGSIGPIIGVIEIVALGAVSGAAISRITTDERVAEQMLTYSKASAFETGCIFAMLQIIIYLPMARSVGRAAHTLACAQSRKPGKDGSEIYDFWIKECGLEDRSAVQPIGRILAVMSPLVAATAVNLLSWPG